MRRCCAGPPEAKKIPLRVVVDIVVVIVVVIVIVIVIVSVIVIAIVIVIVIIIRIAIVIVTKGKRLQQRMQNKEVWLVLCLNFEHQENMKYRVECCS